MMKKVTFLILIILVSGVFTVVANNNKGDKKKAKKAVWENVTKETIILNTPTDSVSYATGMAASHGLMDYLQKVVSLDSMYLDDFKQGFYDTMHHGDDPQAVAYNAGTQIAAQVMKQIYPREAEPFEGISDSLNFQVFYSGFIDGAMNDTTLFTMAEAIKYANNQKIEITRKVNDAYNAENAEWLEANKEKEGVVTLPSGLQYKVIKEGSGEVPTIDNSVIVKYEGKMIDGTVFDSSYERDPDTTSFKPNQVIKGWSEALCMMPEGSKWELYIPQELGYGARQAGKIKPYSTLIFTVEVVKVE